MSEEQLTTQEPKRSASRRKPAPEATQQPAFQEWKCEVKNGQAEKLKLVRACVKITEDEANVLNEGRLHSGNKIVNLYYPAE